jgi:hypothetical protein
MRTDISEYLIHFLRTPKTADAPNFNNLTEDTCEDLKKPYYPLVEDNEICDEFECLINIIEEGGLRASFSYRNGKPTIYGGHPVVCFTEMPLLNFLEYEKDRNNDNRITKYGFALLKKEVFKHHGRPVISGLSATSKFSYLNKDQRIINPKLLPIEEQYRYVGLDLVNGIDWTHEREWRVKCDLNDQSFSIRDDWNDNIHYTWGVPIFTDFYFSEVVIIIQNLDEAKRIYDKVQNQLDSGYCKGGAEFCNSIKYLIIEDAIEFLKTNNLTSIEKLPDTVYYSHQSEPLTPNEIEHLTSTIKKCKELASKFADEFHKVTNLKKNSDGFYRDIGGFTFIRCRDTKNKFVRYLIKNKLASSLGEYIWLDDMTPNVTHIQCLTYCEYITQKQIEMLNSELDIKFTMDSRRD